MKINHAILHILDFDSAVNVMSQRELDIESRTVRNFVTTHLRRARTSADNKRATFAENSAFGGELKGYFFGEREFVDLSQQIAEFISSELTKAEKAESTDVLVADFDDDEDARWFAVMLLGSKQAFMHEVGREEGEVRNDIARHYAILPNPSQKVPSYAIVRASTMEIGYVDKKRKIAGEDRMLIPDGLLQCDTGVSGDVYKRQARYPRYAGVPRASASHGRRRDCAEDRGFGGPVRVARLLPLLPAAFWL